MMEPLSYSIPLIRLHKINQFDSEDKEVYNYDLFHDRALHRAS